MLPHGTISLAVLVFEFADCLMIRFRYPNSCFLVMVEDSRVSIDDLNFVCVRLVFLFDG